MAQREMTLICQSCGREFTLPQAEIDAYWEQGMSIPVFCSIKCQINGWKGNKRLYISHKTGKLWL